MGGGCIGELWNIFKLNIRLYIYCDVHVDIV